jgi:hypothetical protein
MRPAAITALVIGLLFEATLFAGVGKPIDDNALAPGERQEILKQLENTEIIKQAISNAGEDKIHAILERIPDSDLQLISGKVDEMVSGGLAMTLGEAIAQLILYVFLVGILVLLLVILGIAALFAGGAAASSTTRGAPMGSAQYEEQRRKVEDTKRLKEPDRIQR